MELGGGEWKVRVTYPIHVLELVEHHEAVGGHTAPAYEKCGTLHAQPLPARAAAVEGVQRAVEGFFFDG